MTTRKATICICDICHHRWLPENPRKLPQRCAKCKTFCWNRPKIKDSGPKKDDAK